MNAPLRMLFIIDPLDTLNPKTDTTLALIEECERRGYDNYVCGIEDIFIKDGRAHFHSQKITGQTTYTTSSADDFQVVFMRKDPPVDERFLAALYMLRCYDPKKTLMVNEPDGLLIANEKLFGLKIAPELYPKTLVASSKHELHHMASLGKVVIKPLFSCGGRGVMVLERNDKNLASALELVSEGYTKPIIMQEYIAHAHKGDKRILLLGGEALGAVLRVPKGDDHRANFHAGGRAEPASVTPHEERIIKALAPTLKAFGLHFVGIDVIEGFLTEINVTSPTGLLEMESFLLSHDKNQLRERIVNYMEQNIA